MSHGSDLKLCSFHIRKVYVNGGFHKRHIETNFCEMNNVSFSFKCNIQFNWQFPTTNSCFWLVNILLQKFDTSSKNIKTQILWWKTKQKKPPKSIWNCKVALFILNSPHWPVMEHVPNFRETSICKTITLIKCTGKHK